MNKNLIEYVTGSLEEKKRYKGYKSRKQLLPENYRQALDAVERYLTYFGSITKGDVLVQMLEDLIDLFEQGAQAQTPIRDLVGADPVAFVEDFLRNYSEGQWINKERTRLVQAIDAAAGE